MNNKKERKLLLRTICTIILVISMSQIFINGMEAKATSSQVVQLIDEASKHFGKPYVYGAQGPDTFDCSGFTSYVYRTALGIDIGRTTFDQIDSGTEVAYEDLQMGDLVFPHEGHVGIYIGGGMMIHAPQIGDVVKVDKVYKFWRARRIVESSEMLNYMFDSDYYAYRYPNLKEQYSNNAAKLYEHYLAAGIKQGDSASLIFDPKYYLEQNIDLKDTFKDDYVQAYKHFVDVGYKENRASSEVFNIAVYKSIKNPDLINIDNVALYAHFLQCGINEGRVASDNFNINDYRSNKYLQNLYGDNLKYYYYDYAVDGIMANKHRVKFIDYNETEIGDIQQVEDGQSAVAPTNLSRMGYTFKGWDKDFSSVKEDLVVKAIYEESKIDEPKADKIDSSTETPSTSKTATGTPSTSTPATGTPSTKEEENKGNITPAEDNTKATDGVLGDKTIESPNDGQAKDITTTGDFSKVQLIFPLLLGLIGVLGSKKKII